MEESANRPIVSVRNEIVQRLSDFGAHSSNYSLGQKTPMDLTRWVSRKGNSAFGMQR